MCLSHSLTLCGGKIVVHPFLITLCTLVSARRKSGHVGREGAGLAISHW